MARIPRDYRLTPEDIAKGPEWLAELKRRMREEAPVDEDIYDNLDDAEKAKRPRPGDAAGHT